MFKIGDLIVYSGHGICQIDDICDRTFAGITKSYYILQPIDNSENITISTPVENSKANIHKMIDKQEASEIIDTFKGQGAVWIERPQQRAQAYMKILQSGDRKGIAEVANTLLRKKEELEQADKKLYEQDVKILTMIQNVLFKELAIALDMTYEEVMDQITKELQHS